MLRPVALKDALPLFAEFLEFIFSDFDILLQLSLLDISPKFVLIIDDVLLKLSNLLHQVLEELILVNLVELLRQKTHFLLDQRKNQDLFILIQKAIFIVIENFDNLCWSVQSKKILKDVSVFLND